MSIFESAVFGNRDGSHQLLSSSLPTTAAVLATLRFLVDRPAGHVGPEVTWFPYWGCQRIGDWWVLWRGEEDQNAPRKNMVAAKAALLPIEHCATIDNIEEILLHLGHSPSDSENDDVCLAASVVDCLAEGGGPAIIADVSLAPYLLRTIWPRLWPSARASFSLRTLFGVESLESVSKSSIVLIPKELKPRWHGQYLVEEGDVQPGTSARWLDGSASECLLRLITANASQLPEDYSVLARIERLSQRLERLIAGFGTITDALVILRTQEAFVGGLTLARDDTRVLVATMSKLDDASIDDIRMASLTKLDTIPDTGIAEAALAQWVEAHLAEQSLQDTIWIIEQHTGEAHATWWRRGIGAGLDAGCRGKSQQWAATIWRSWQDRPESVRSMIGHIEKTQQAENWLAKHAPSSSPDELVGILSEVCRDREWPNLLARVLGSTRPLAICVETLRVNLSRPEAGIDALLAGRSAAEIVSSAASTGWAPLIAKAVPFTLAEPDLLIGSYGTDGILALLSHHLLNGGGFPVAYLRDDFLTRVFDAAISGQGDGLRIIKFLDKRAARFILDYPKSDTLLTYVSPEIASEVAEEWWRRFLADSQIGRPPSILSAEAIRIARRDTGQKSITLVLGLLHLFTEIKESDFDAWMSHTGFAWEDGDYQRVASLLVERQWKAATKAFRYSWKRELKLVAWYARDLLSWSDRFWSQPEGVHQSAPDDTFNIDTKIKRQNLAEESMTIIYEKPTPAEFTHGHALVIGIAAYPHVSKLPDIILKDAKDLAAIITSKDCGYPNANVELLLDSSASADGIRKALQRLAAVTGVDDTVIFYFSGHGGRIETGPDAGTYLIPFDCDPHQLRRTAINSDELTMLFSAIKAQRFIALLDACHSAGAGELKALAPLAEVKAGLDEKIYDALAKGAGRVIMASSRSNEVSLILNGMQNSLFTHYLLEAMKGASAIPGEEVVRVFNVFHYVSDKVPTKASTQHPIFKAHDVENNFPIVLHQGGTKATCPASAPVASVRPTTLSGKTRLEITNRLVTRWEDLATYFEIPLSGQAIFEKGREPSRILSWLEQRNRLGELRDAFNYLGWDDLVEVLDRSTSF